MDWIYVFIPLAPFMLGGLVIWTRHQARVLDHQTRLAAEKAAQYASGTAQLEERVRVLEKIVTDGGIQTAAQIEALRELPKLDIGEEAR